MKIVFKWQLFLWMIKEVFIHLCPSDIKYFYTFFCRKKRKFPTHFCFLDDLLTGVRLCVSRDFCDCFTPCCWRERFQSIGGHRFCVKSVFSCGFYEPFYHWLQVASAIRIIRDIVKFLPIFFLSWMTMTFVIDDKTACFCYKTKLETYSLGC